MLAGNSDIGTAAVGRRQLYAVRSLGQLPGAVQADGLLRRGAGFGRGVGLFPDMQVGVADTDNQRAVGIRTLHHHRLGRNGGHAGIALRRDVIEGGIGRDARGVVLDDVGRIVTAHNGAGSLLFGPGQLLVRGLQPDGVGIGGILGRRAVDEEGRCLHTLVLRLRTLVAAGLLGDLHTNQAFMHLVMVAVSVAKPALRTSGHLGSESRLVHPLPHDGGSGLAGTVFHLAEGGLRGILGVAVADAGAQADHVVAEAEDGLARPEVGGEVLVVGLGQLHGEHAVPPLQRRGSGKLFR